MAATGTGLTSAAVGVDDSVVEAVCDRLESLWRNSPPPPSLIEFLTGLGWHRDDPEQRIADEVAAIDLELRWIADPPPGDALGGRPTAEDYALALYGRGGRQAPTLWVVAEWNARVRSGDQGASVVLRERYRERPEVLAAIDGVSRDAETHGPPPRRSASRGFRLRCPQCHQATTLVVDSDLTDVVCDACGCSFDLVDQNRDTRAAATITRLGSFELIERLGFGAFGTVWKARDTRLDRTVAVKVPRRGALTREETEMFLREARAAAQLRHANIVTVHEVGVADGTPFLVTDFIRGVSLSDHLSTGDRMSAREAAELTRSLALAIDHAHRHGVIHRDLKPANVMIDDRGEPHVMDFGLAKRTVADVTMTIEGQVLGTPAYMSPEQARGDADRADARTDVYSLGAMLFEFLTGETPFRGSVQMLLKQAIEVEAPSPRSLNRATPADLDTICLKCLEKDPARRYRTAEALAEDLALFLGGMPIHARPIGAVGRRWRWCRRNPLVASLLAAVAASLTGLSGVSSFAAWRMSQVLADKDAAAGAAREVSAFLVDLFSSTDTISSAIDGEQGFFTSDPGAANVTARELLDRGSERIATRLADQPATKVALLETMGDAYFGLGLYTRSADSFRDAAAIATDLGPLAHARLEHKLGVALLVDGDYQSSEAVLREALASRERDLGRESIEYTSTLIALGTTIWTGGGNSTEAEALIRQGIDVRVRLRGPDDPCVAYALSALAAFQMSHDPDQAQTTVMRMLAILQSDRNRGDWEQFGDILGGFMRGVAAMDAEEFVDAERELCAATEGAERLLGSSHPFLSFGLFELGRSLENLGRYEECVATYTRAIETAGKTVKKTHPKFMIGRRSLAGVLMRLGELQRALSMIESALADADETYGAGSPEYAEVVSECALVLSSMGRHEEAIARATEAARAAAAAGEPAAKIAATTRRSLAECLMRAGRAADAIAELKAGLDTQEPNLDDLELLAEAQVAARDFAGLDETIARGTVAGGTTGRNAPGWVARFDTLKARALVAQGEPAAAILLLGRAEIVLETLYGSHDDWLDEAKQVAQEAGVLQAADQKPGEEASSPAAAVDAAR